MTTASSEHVTKRDATTEVPTPRPAAVLAAHFQPPPVEDVRQPGSWTPFLVCLWLLGLTGAVAWICADYASGFAKVDAARAEMKVIAQALDNYRLAHMEYPARLEVLLEQETESAPYFKDIKPITTPWGVIYGYDPTYPNGPLISCSTPSGERLTLCVGEQQP
jgi:hypothetical protein